MGYLLQEGVNCANGTSHRVTSNNKSLNRAFTGSGLHAAPERSPTSLAVLYSFDEILERKSKNLLRRNSVGYSLAGGS